MGDHMLWDSDSSERKEATHLPHSHPLILHSKKKKKNQCNCCGCCGLLLFPRCSSRARLPPASSAPAECSPGRSLVCRLRFFCRYLRFLSQSSRNKSALGVCTGSNTGSSYALSFLQGPTLGLSENPSGSWKGACGHMAL